jgi:ABC-type transport system involved in multi-copper enzyme maturation permease subunit
VSRERRPLPRTPWIGPLAGWELLRLARRGQSHRGRLLVVYLLLIAFILTPVFWFNNVDPLDLFLTTRDPLTPPEAAAFANRFALSLLQAILLAVSAMTPGYAAAAIADEKERGTLALLLTTALSDREIVLGKAVGRLVFVLAAAAAGVPVLAVTTLLGGVDPRFLLCGFGLVIGTTVLSAAIGINAACAADDLRGALVRAYGITALAVGVGFIPPCVFASPFGVLVMVEGGQYGILPYLLVGVGYPVLQIAVASGFLTTAIPRLRRASTAPVVARPAPRVTPAIIEPPLRAPALETDDLRERRSNFVPIDRPRVSDNNPLLWKERYVTGRATRQGEGDAGRIAIVALGGLGVVLLVIGVWNLVDRLLSTKPRDDEGGRIVMTAAVFFAGLYLFPAAIALASAVARERRRQTLEPLLALPYDRRTILWTKVRAATERGWWWGVAAVLAAGLSFGADGGWLFGVVAAALVLSGGWFVIGLGCWLTVRSPSETRAFRFLVPAVVVVVGAPVGVFNATDWLRPEWSVIGLVPMVIGFALIGTLLWRRAWRDLERL